MTSYDYDDWYDDDDWRGKEEPDCYGCCDSGMGRTILGTTLRCPDCNPGPLLRLVRSIRRPIVQLIDRVTRRKADDVWPF